MSDWFRFWGKKEASGGTRSIEEPPTVHRSLALKVLYHQFRGDRKYRILDLGPAVGKNIEFFSQFSCRIHIEDLYGTLSSFDYFSPEDGFSYDAVYSYLLPYYRTSYFDFILSWDLFNYLDRDELRHLTKHLGKYSRRGTMLYGLLSTKKHIPETPHRFTIIDQENLLYKVNSPVFRVCPRYEPSDLPHLIPNFRICNSFVLRNGYREYLFLYE